MKKFKLLALIVSLLSILPVNAEYCTHVRASHILLKTEKEANEMIDYLNKGVSFGELARNFSACPSKVSDGDLDYFSRGQMVWAFENKAFSMKKGEISQPVKTQYGWHIIKVTDKICK
ncbi:peptidylprolyl isomerase [bacterium]|nr:peptidylprolyl isomerase [bacterium]